MGAGRKNLLASNTATEVDGKGVDQTGAAGTRRDIRRATVEISVSLKKTIA
jgi:hypothetical protein